MILWSQIDGTNVIVEGGSVLGRRDFGCACVLFGHRTRLEQYVTASFIHVPPYTFTLTSVGSISSYHTS